MIRLSVIAFRRQKIGRSFNFEIFLAPDCWYPAYFADTYCDDDNNNAECNYDGGDCCNNDKDGWNNFCSACDCKDPSGKEPIHVIWFLKKSENSQIHDSNYLPTLRPVNDDSERSIQEAPRKDPGKLV